jgi:hypothetical protein
MEMRSSSILTAIASFGWMNNLNEFPLRRANPLAISRQVELFLKLLKLVLSTQLLKLSHTVGWCYSDAVTAHSGNR